jgi:predicted TPR repeat methyltransferase
VWEPADRAAQARDWPRAVALYAKALQHVPRFPGVWVQYGHSLKESGDTAAAENAYRRATELDPTVGEVYLHLGHVLSVQHRRVASGQQPEAVVSYWRSLIGEPVS